MIQLGIARSVTRVTLLQRLTLTGVAALQAIAGVTVSLALAVLMILSIVTIPVGIGVIGLLLIVPLLGTWSSWQRTWLSKFLGLSLETAYRMPSRAGV